MDVKVSISAFPPASTPGCLYQTSTVKELGPRPYGDFVPGEGPSAPEARQRVLDQLAAYHAKEGKKKK